MEPGAWGYNWAHPITGGDINTETWPSRLRVGRKADDLVLWKISVAKSKEVKTGCNLAEFSEEGYGSKRAAFPMMTMMMSLSLMLRPTVSRPVCLGVKHPFGAYDQIFITCVTVKVLFLWGALSDDRSGLSFVCAAGLCQRSLSRVQVPWDMRPYFTVSHLRLLFSSPPTTRRVTVEVFDPVSTRVRLLNWVWVLCYDRRSAGQSVLE
jgi:hypothetical protein